MIRTPVWLTFLAGMMIIVFLFIARPPFPNIQTWALKWDIIVSAFALALGFDSLVMHNLRRIQRRENTLYAATLLVGFFLSIIWGGWAWWRYGSPFRADSTYLWLFRYIIVPMDATMFALLAFFIASAAYRAFRARDLSSSLLLVSASIVMLGRVPYGDVAAVPFAIAFGLLLGYYFLVHFRYYEGVGRFVRLLVGVAFLGVAVALLVPQVFGWAKNLVFPLASWVMEVPQMAARRGIDMGLSLGSLAFSLRVLVGIERGYMR